jgi:hemolysin activation/secretion protein
MSVFHVSKLCLFAVTIIAATSMAGYMVPAWAQTLPGSASADRVDVETPQTFKVEPAPPSLNENIGSNIRYSQPPPNGEQIHLQLISINVTGVTIYSEDDIKSIFANDIGKKISLARIWEISDEITKKYRQDGYFLSRAFIPAQEITDGHVTIRVAEGYIKKVEIEEGLLSSSVVRDITNKITSERPTSSKTLEHYHLLLTDLSGLQNLYGTLAPLENQQDGGVRLIYSRNKLPTSNGFISLNNYGSKFLGPLQAGVQWQGNLIGVQETFLAARASLPLDELLAANISQTIPLSPETSLMLLAGVTQAKPGFTLSPQEIESRSLDIGFKLNHKIIRQRNENWSVDIGLDGRNSKSTILGSTELSEDKVRAVRFGTVYDTYDPLDGFNRISLTASHGINGLGASDKNDINISRNGAEPDFKKIEAEYLRYQSLPYQLGTLLTLRGQKASDSLYSSEEFGFGGQLMGRAYDSSEITGDDGVALSVELQYQDIPAYINTTIKPYAFYDIGKVWNKNIGQEATISASSAGLGVRLEHDSGLSGTFELAFPLTKTVDNPIYGDNKTAPRIGLQIGYKF